VRHTRKAKACLQIYSSPSQAIPPIKKAVVAQDKAGPFLSLLDMDGIYEAKSARTKGLNSFSTS
jgi:hypothetical protein